VFDNLKKSTWKLEPPDQPLADAISSAWVRFAATGDPNGAGLPYWQPYNPDAEEYLDFGDTIQTGHGLLAAECDFYEAFIASTRAKTAP
jgi:carboxylesterase type B